MTEPALRLLPDDLLQRLCADRSYEVVERAQHQRRLREPFTEVPGHPDEEVLVLREAVTNVARSPTPDRCTSPSR